MSADAVLEIWEPYTQYSNSRWFIGKTRDDEYSIEVSTSTGTLWVSKHGWYHDANHTDSIQRFIDAVRQNIPEIEIVETTIG